MPNNLIFPLLATLAISALSLVGAISFVIKPNLLKKISFYLLAFSTGALIGGAFFHLLPEAVEIKEGLSPYVFLVLGIAAFFILEKFLKWHHCHNDGECEVHTFTYMSLVGDSFHNFIDGLVIAGAFFISPELGIATTIAVAAHELPQEMGDFGVLIHGGFSRKKALIWNVIVSLAAIIGAICGYFLISQFENINAALLPFAAGGFVYIAMSDLVPELHKETKLTKSLLNFGVFIIGIIFMLAIKLYFEG